MTGENRPKSWWETLPGTVTAVAALVTAGTGLLLALHQTGWLHKSDAAGHDEVQEEAQGPAGQPAVKSNNPGGLSVKLSVNEVTLGEGKFTLLSERVARRTPETVGLNIGVRMLNNGRYPAHFSNYSFRLFVDGIPRAPTGDINKVVDAGSAEEGDLEFTFPANTNSLMLLVRYGPDSTQIPLQWRNR